MVVFYADDDLDDRELFADALEEVNPQIKLILDSNGHEIIELLENHETPDFIFLDINMPVMSGKECLKQLKRLERLKSVPIIMYTTTSNKEEFKNLVLLGAADCVVKGVSFQAIKESLRNILND
ncbi:MAG TPA: response regulator [Chryseolinea sp.]|nr:response regulator [Chryseolinea sp.]